MTPKLTFVIPAHNEEANIAKCLSSIEAQLKEVRRDAEIIVVNNACTDGTKRIASSFKGVTVVDEPNKGLVKARRAGFLASHGDLIANVDADTLLTPGWIEKVIKEFGDHPDIVALSGPYIYYDLSTVQRACIRLFYYGGYFFSLINRFILKNGAMLQGGNFIVRRDALLAIGGFNTEQFDFYGEDTDLARRLNAVGPVKFMFDLPMYTSGRRVMQEGLLRTGYHYAMNYFWTIFFKRPFTKSSTDVRQERTPHK